MDKIFPNQKGYMVRNMEAHGYEIILLDDMKKGERLVFKYGPLARLMRREQDGIAVFSK